MVLYKNRALGKDAYYCSNKSVKLPKIVDGDENTYEVTSDTSLSMGIDLGQLYPIGKIRMKALAPYANTTIDILGGPDCTTSPSDKLKIFSFWSSPAWLEADVSKTVRYITIMQWYRHVIYEVQVNEILTTTTLSVSLDKSIVAPNPPNAQFTVAGNVKDQYNEPMNGQFVSIKIYSGTTVIADASTTADANGNFSSIVPTISWSPGAYEVRVVSDSLTQSLNLTVIYMSTIIFNSICSDTGQACPADVYLDNTLRGTTPLTLNDVPIGTHNYRISKTGYVDATGTVNVQQGVTATVNVNLNPAIGSLYFSSEPEGAAIILDGFTQSSLTPATLMGIPTGSHNYILRKNNFKDYPGPAGGTVEVLLGQTTNVSATLIPVEGCVYFTSIPPGAKIIVDDVDTGKVTPDLVCGLALGIHTYKLLLAGYQSSTGTVDLTSGQGVTVGSTLVVAKGNISFGSVPGGAEVFLDGADQGVMTPVTITDVPAGSHGFTLKLASYNDFTGTVLVEENLTASVSVSLIPAEGCLYFNTTPQGARIFIDDLEQAGITTPALICGIPLGAHTYRLVLDGHYDKTGSITLVSGRGEDVIETLIPLPTTGSLNITSTPPSAKIFIDGVDREMTTPATISGLTPGSHTYKLTLAGYKDATGTFTITAGQTTTASATLTQVAAKPGVGAGTIVVLGLLGAGVLGAVVYASKENKPPTGGEYLKYPPQSR